MITRRQSLQFSIAAASLLALDPRSLIAGPAGLITRAVPSTGEQLPVVGLGSSATFSALAGSEDVDALREVLSAMSAHGGTVFDTAPSYGASEEVAGRLAGELGLKDKLFWATKLNVPGLDGSGADPAAARAQIETSFARVGKAVIDLIQVHNVADIPVHLGLLKELREEGRIRHLGITNTRPDLYDELERLMRTERLDFIGIDYAIDNLKMAERILPLALDRGIGVLVYAPFGRTRLWDRVRGQPLPDWATEFGAASWAQFFLKFVIAHPAVTVATPATSKAHHMIDNMGAALGTLPDPAMQRRMVEHIAGL